MMRTTGRALRTLFFLNVAVHVTAQGWEGGTPPPFNQGFDPAPAPAPAPAMSAAVVDETDTAALAAEIIAGEVIGFLNETNPPITELNCIKFGASEISTAVVATSSHIVDLLQTVFGKRRLQERRLLPPGEEGGGTASIVPDLKQTMADIISMVHGRTFDCLHAQGINDFKMAAAHLGDLHFMQQSLLANGADISFELTSAIQAWRAKKYGVFGGYMGQAWRRVLLGGPQQFNQLSAPPDFAIQQMTNGMLNGFFGNGFEMKMGVHKLGRIEEVDISLHSCIAENMMFFRSAWGAIAGLFGGLKQQANGVQLTPEQQKAAGRREQAALAQALMTLPGALSRCSDANGEPVSLKEALGAFEDGRMSLQLPQRSTATIDLSVDLTAALKMWTNHDFTGFGFRLGRLLQRVALLAFPQKYSVDKAGSLQRLVGDWSVDTTTDRFGGLGLVSVGTLALLSFISAGFIVYRQAWKVSAARDTNSYRPALVLEREPLRELESQHSPEE